MSTQEEREAAQELREAGFSEEYIRDLRPEYDDLLAERDRLRVVNGQLLAACIAIAELLDEGYLVRDTSHDAEDGWAVKQIPLIMKLAKLPRAIAEAQKATGGQ